MIHLFDRKGQQVGLFHGSEFVPLNLVFYINGLTNAHPHPEPGLFERLFGWLS
jgi:protein SCO1/2